MALNVKTSIVDLLKSKGMDSSWDARTKLANDNGIKNYTGTAAQNKQLMDIVNSSVSDTQKAAEKNIAATTNPTKNVNGSKVTGEQDSIVQAMSVTPQSQTSQLQVAPQQPETMDVKAIYDSVMQSVGAAPTYQSNYKDQLDGLLAQIAGRPDFSYDQGSDPMYQQYRDQYTANGNKAMRDTMGNAAALTGGYGSSYATTAGSQAYDAYMEGLNNAGMDLRDRAYQQYQDEGNDLINQYNAYASAEDRAYQQYLQEYAMWGDRLNTEMGIADAQINQANSDRNYALDYDKFTYDKEQDEKSWEYQLNRDKIADAQWAKDYELSQSKTDSANANEKDDSYTLKELDSMRASASKRALELKDNMVDEETIIAAVYMEYPQQIAEDVLKAMGYLTDDDLGKKDEGKKNNTGANNRTSGARVGLGQVKAVIM